MRQKLLLLFFFVLILPFPVFAIGNREEASFVIDEAHVLKKDTISYINDSSTYLHEKELIDYYVIVIRDLGDMDMEEYAEELFKTYSISDNGILILVSRGNGLLRIQVGSDLSQFIDGNLIDQYIDSYFSPYIEAGDWDKGIQNGYNAFYKLILENCHLDSSEVRLLDNVDFKTKYSNYIIMLFAFLSMGFAKVLMNMYQNIFIKKRYQDSTKDYFLMALVMGLNVAMFVVCFFIRPASVLIVLMVEVVGFYSFFSNGKKFINPYAKENNIKTFKKSKKETLKR